MCLDDETRYRRTIISNAQNRRFELSPRTRLGFWPSPGLVVEDRVAPNRFIRVCRIQHVGTAVLFNIYQRYRLKAYIYELTCFRSNSDDFLAAPNR